METNNIYVTKKEFYSNIMGILAVVGLIVAFSKSAKEFSWREYFLIFLIITNLIFYLYKAIKEMSKSKSFSQADK